VSVTLKRRWGIVVVGILMLFVTMVTMALSGQKASFYIFVWLMVSYYGYKGNLYSIKQWMKWLIFINLVALFFILIFTDNSTVTYLADSKMELVLGVLIMLIPKVLLFFYVGVQLDTDKTSEISTTKKKDENLFFQSYSSLKDANLTTKASEVKNNIPNNPQVEEQKEMATPIDEDKLWEIAADEVDGDARKKSMWAKCFAEADGEENKAKASYLKLRVAELKAEMHTKEKQVEEVNISPIAETNTIETMPITMSCPMCRTTNLRKRDDCSSCGYDFRQLKKIFGK